MVVGNGVYVQTRGPRLETKAEVKMLDSFGDIVGMTIASEATLARELDVKYAAICSVDNYAHGLVSKELDFEDVKEIAEKNSARVEKLLTKVVDEIK